MAYYYNRRASIGEAIGELVKFVTAQIMEKQRDGYIDIVVEDDGSVFLESPKECE